MSRKQTREKQSRSLVDDPSRWKKKEIDLDLLDGSEDFSGFLGIEEMSDIEAGERLIKELQITSKNGMVLREPKSLGILPKGLGSVVPTPNDAPPSFLSDLLANPNNASPNASSALGVARRRSEPKEKNPSVKEISVNKNLESRLMQDGLQILLNEIQDPDSPEAPGDDQHESSEEDNNYNSSNESSESKHAMENAELGVPAQGNSESDSMQKMKRDSKTKERPNSEEVTRSCAEKETKKVLTGWRPSSGWGTPSGDEWRKLGINTRIADAVGSALGFVSPTEIQSLCIPKALEGKDIIAAAETGSGKTLAFGLPLLHRVVMQGNSSADDKSYLHALVLTPTRELAMQVCDHIQKVAKLLPFCPRIHPIVGGISVQKQARFLRKKPGIIVGTPGRTWDLMQLTERDKERRKSMNIELNSGVLSHLRDLRSLSGLVIDEADRMLQLGQFREMIQILQVIFPSLSLNDRGPFKVKRMRKTSKTSKSSSRFVPLTPGERSLFNSPTKRVQIGIYSATLTLPETMRKRTENHRQGHTGTTTLEIIMDVLPLQKPFVADVTAKDHLLPERIKEFQLKCNDEYERDAYLYAFLRGGSSQVISEGVNRGRTIIFANTISSAKRLNGILTLLMPEKIFVLHASQQQRQRLKSLDRFRNTLDGILIATDVASRGLDIPAVKQVVHYQLPASSEMYIHRSGRTARMQSDGTVISVSMRGDAVHLGKIRTMRTEGSASNGTTYTLPPSLKFNPNVQMGAMKLWKLAVKLDEINRIKRKTAATKQESLEESQGNLDPERTLEGILKSIEESGRNELNPEEEAAFESVKSVLQKGSKPNSPKSRVSQKKIEDELSITKQLSSLMRMKLEEVGSQMKRKPKLNTLAQRSLHVRAKRARVKKRKLLQGHRGRKK